MACVLCLLFLDRDTCRVLPFFSPVTVFHKLPTPNCLALVLKRILIHAMRPTALGKGKETLHEHQATMEPTTDHINDHINDIPDLRSVLLTLGHRVPRRSRSRPFALGVGITDVEANEAKGLKRSMKRFYGFRPCGHGVSIGRAHQFRGGLSMEVQGWLILSHPLTGRD